MYMPLSGVPILLHEKNVKISPINIYLVVYEDQVFICVRYCNWFTYEHKYKMLISLLEI